MVKGPLLLISGQAARGPAGWQPALRESRRRSVASCNVREWFCSTQIRLSAFGCVARERWQLIVKAKHPVMAGRENSVRLCLENPDEVRRSSKDSTVMLSHRLE